MNFYLAQIKKIFISMVILLSIRLIFVAYNWEQFAHIEFIELLKAYLLGIRFDIASSMFICALSFIIDFIPFEFPLKRFLSKSIFLLTVIVAVVFLVVDIEFFLFIGKKLTVDVFDLGAEIGNQSASLLSYYWKLVLLGLIFIGLAFWLYPKKYTKQRGPWYVKLPLNMLLLGICFIGIRGGLQMRTMSAKDAFVFKDFILGNVALNPIYTLVRSLRDSGVKTYAYFPNREAAINEILDGRGERVELNFKDQNVFVIILESFSYEYFHLGYMPYLKELSEKSLNTKFNYANGRRSMEVMPSIFTSVPALLDNTIYKTAYQANKFYTLPNELKNHGYKSYFFHGGEDGTMDFNSYAVSIGFDKYYSQEDYPDQSHFDGNWGISDHYYLSFVADTVNTYQEPFMASVFTLSSHHPYNIPKEFHGTFPKGTTEIHEVIGYSDHALKLFFEKAEKMPWFKNTLFVITADHTQKMETKEFNNHLGHYRVPLIFFHPTINLTDFETKPVTQHADIFPSVLNFLGLPETQPIVMGESVFSKSKGDSINRISGNFIYVYGDHYLLSDGEKMETFNLSPMGTDGELNTDSETNQLMQNRFKAFVQYFYNGLKFNDLYM